MGLRGVSGALDWVARPRRGPVRKACAGNGDGRPGPTVSPYANASALDADRHAETALAQREAKRADFPRSAKDPPHLGGAPFSTHELRGAMRASVREGITRGAGRRGSATVVPAPTSFVSASVATRRAPTSPTSAASRTASREVRKSAGCPPVSRASSVRPRRGASRYG